MHKFSGIYMGRRRKQTGEAEAEMEGSGEDSEPQMIAGIARDLQRSIEYHRVTLFITYRRARRQHAGDRPKYQRP
jgi:hypothetical protein